MEIITRNQARIKRLTQYFSGRPCPYGHVTWRMLSTGACVECKKVRLKRYFKSPKGRSTRTRINARFNATEARRTIRKNSRVKLRCEVIDYYSRGKNVCACCGEFHVELLTIDHIKGGGRQHRKQIKSNGFGFYEWLKRQNFPAGYRVLCFNCNFGEHVYGQCPHKRKLT